MVSRRAPRRISGHATRRHRHFCRASRGTLPAEVVWWPLPRLLVPRPQPSIHYRANVYSIMDDTPKAPSEIQETQVIASRTPGALTSRLPKKSKRHRSPQSHLAGWRRLLPGSGAGPTMRASRGGLMGRRQGRTRDPLQPAARRGDPRSPAYRVCPGGRRGPAGQARADRRCLRVGDDLRRAGECDPIAGRRAGSDRVRPGRRAGPDGTEQPGSTPWCSTGPRWPAGP